MTFEPPYLGFSLLLLLFDDGRMSVRINLQEYDEKISKRNAFVTYVVGLGALVAGLAFYPSVARYRLGFQLLSRYPKGVVLDYHNVISSDRGVLEALLHSQVETVFMRCPRIEATGDDVTDEDMELERNFVLMKEIVRKDPELRESSITFALYPELQGHPGHTVDGPSRLFNSVLVDGLCSEVAEESLSKALFIELFDYLQPGGCLIFQDVGRPHYPVLQRFFSWYGNKTSSSLCFSHPIDHWVEEGQRSGKFTVEYSKRLLLGFQHAYVLKKC
jgi:hypothetical protein